MQARERAVAWPAWAGAAAYVVAVGADAEGADARDARGRRPARAAQHAADLAPHKVADVALVLAGEGQHRPHPQRPHVCFARRHASRAAQGRAAHCAAGLGEGRRVAEQGLGPGGATPRTCTQPSVTRNTKGSEGGPPGGCALSTPSAVRSGPMMSVRPRALIEPRTQACGGTGGGGRDAQRAAWVGGTPAAPAAALGRQACRAGHLGGSQVLRCCGQQRAAGREPQLLVIKGHDREAVGGVQRAQPEHERGPAAGSGRHSAASEPVRPRGLVWLLPATLQKLAAAPAVPALSSLGKVHGVAAHAAAAVQNEDDGAREGLRAGPCEECVRVRHNGLTRSQSNRRVGAATAPPIPHPQTWPATPPAARAPV